MKKKYDVVCIGDATLDITMCNINPNALCVDASYSDKTGISLGGDASNQASVLSKLGCKTALIAKIGTDDFGDIIYKKICEENLDSPLLIRCEEKGSGFCVVIVKPDGQRNFLVWPGNGKKDLLLDEIDLSFLSETKIVSVGSLFCLKELDRGGIREIFREAQSRKVITIADMTTDGYRIGPDAIADIYPYTDYLIPSFEEACYVTGETDPECIAQKLLDAGVKNVIIKLGAKGCYVRNRSENFYTDPYDATVVDTTGCGDNFVAGFITGLLHQFNLKQCAELACACGSYNAQFVGAHGSIQSLDQIQMFQRTAKQLDCNR